MHDAPDDRRPANHAIACGVSVIGSRRHLRLQPASTGIRPAAAAKWTTDGKGAGPTKGNANGKTYAKQDVKFTMGSRWKQRYLVPNEETGNLQLMDRQFNRASGQWEPLRKQERLDHDVRDVSHDGVPAHRIRPSESQGAEGEWKEMSVGHVASKSKADIWNFAGKSPQVQTRTCGYCHIRVENDQFKSAQGNAREDLPAPKAGESPSQVTSGRSGTPTRRHSAGPGASLWRPPLR